MADPTRTTAPPDGPPVTRSLADGTATGGDASTSTPVVLPATAGRYQLGAEIARGGMGAVYRAMDSTLGREVAIKVLGDKYAPGSATARRFHDEARITGQLQHPGIPPVHDLGTLPDGRPFLAMKLIKGDTLDDLLKGRRDPTADRGRFIAVFEQVCHAVAYAHAHQVIHRDLKPANVMVGAFGEVQVMDWGLAKLLVNRAREGTGDPDPDATAPGTVVQSLRDSAGSETQAGAVLGTPAYMPPEQALGTIALIDARSDVFGLGAVLAVVLTGHPPFAGGSTDTARLRSARGDVADCFERLDGCGADPELIALAKRCLSPKPEGRPADAGEVARAVATLRQAADERARAAEIDRERAEVTAAEQRKRRRVQLALAAAGLTIAGLVGGGLWWEDHRAAGRRADEAVRAADERGRRERNAEAVAALLDQAELALTADDGSKAEAALDAAEKRVDDGGADDSAERLARLRADLRVGRDLDAADRFLWTPIDAKYPDADQIADRYRAALAGFGAGPDAPADAVAARISRSAVRDRLVFALDQMLVLERSDQALAVLQVVDADPFRDPVRAAVRSGAGRRVADLADRPEATAQPPEFAVVLGGHPAVPLARRRAVLAAAVGRQPAALPALMAMGATYPINRREGAEERVRWYQAAAAVAPANPATHNLLGVALIQRGQPAAAVPVLREGVRLAPRDPVLLANLAIALHGSGNVDESLAVAREAVRVAPDYYPVRRDLVNVLRLTGDLDAAIAECRAALRLRPDDPGMHIHLGLSLRAKNDLPGAIAAYREALRLDPKSASGHNNLGVALHYSGKSGEAIDAFREAVRLDPNYLDARLNLGTTYKDTKDLPAAIAVFRDAARLEPANAVVQYNLGIALNQHRDRAAAEAAYREAVRLDPTHPEAHCNLGNLLFRGLGRPADALPFLRKGHELGSRRAGWKYPSARWVAECEKAAAEQQPPREVLPQPRRE